jgi:hypothetical protein
VRPRVGAWPPLAALRRSSTDDSTHTHPSGQVDGKDTRIVAMIAGEQTGEMAPAREVNRP